MDRLSTKQTETNPLEQSDKWQSDQKHMDFLIEAGPNTI